MNSVNDLKSYSRNWLAEFIDKYKKYECLWKSTHPDYCNHNLRYAAYDHLVQKLKEVEPNPDRPMVVKKINSLRSAFRREYRKKCSNSNYQTRLWYYDKLLFIAEQNPRPVLLSQKKREILKIDMDVSDELQESHTTTNSADEKEQYLNDHIDDQTMEEEHVEDPLDESQIAAQDIKSESTKSYKILEIAGLSSLEESSNREHISNECQPVQALEQHHQSDHLHQHQPQPQHTQTAQLTQMHGHIPTIQISREHLPIFNSTSFGGSRHDDEYDAIGINVASKLRAMNLTQRIISERLIGEVLFNGQLNSLTISSKLKIE